MSKIASFGVILLVAGTTAASAQTCSDALSTLVAEALSPVLESAGLCKEFKQRVSTPLGQVTIGVDKTEKVELRDLRYCPSILDSSLQASVFVRCKTSDAAVVRFSVDEVFDIRVLVQNSSCEITDLSITPRGDIGRLLASLVGFSDQIKQAAAEHIKTLCK